MARRPTCCAALALAAVLSVAGCGTASPHSVPTGIDGLVIPTPSPDPADFGRRIDNPWLPYAAGKVWSYSVREEGIGYLRSVTVLAEPERVVGVDTTVVETVTVPAQDGQPHGTPVRTRDLFAEDRAGNVWWFGREGEWQAGTDGAEAGLAMPAHPRYGDGWRAAYQPGAVDVRAAVASVEETASVPAGRYDAVLALDVSDATDGSETRAYYARGVGLVEELSTTGAGYAAELESAPG